VNRKSRAVRTNASMPEYAVNFFGIVITNAGSTIAIFGVNS
jgi:hypothetical protein